MGGRELKSGKNVKVRKALGSIHGQGERVGLKGECGMK